MSKLHEAKRSAVKSILAFMRRSRVNQFLVGYGTFFGIGMLIYFSIVGLIVPTYYAVAPARSFVDYYYARVADTPVGTEPQLTLCRNINYDNVNISAVRTFIYHADGQPNETVGEYSFKANVTKGESTGNCITVRLKGQPQVAGKYTTSTSIEFYVGGHRKTYSYPSNEYKMIAVETTDEEKIQQLQKQIDELKSESGKSSTSDAPRVDPAPTKTDPATQNPASGTQQGTQQGSTSQNGGSAAGNQANNGTDPAAPESSWLLGGINRLLNGLGL